LIGLWGWSFERFCLTAGIEAIEQMLCGDAQQLAGARHSRGGDGVGYRWGRTKDKIGFRGGKVAVHRPRVRSLDGHEVALPTWTAAQAEDWEPDADQRIAPCSTLTTRTMLSLCFLHGRKCGNHLRCGRQHPSLNPLFQVAMKLSQNLSPQL